MKVINSPIELFAFALQEQEFNPNTITLGDGFKVNIVIEGEGWNGDIDYRLANIVLNAQRDFLKMLSEVTGETYNLNTFNKNEYRDSNLKLTFTVRDGSLSAIIDYIPVITEASKMLTSTQVFILFSGTIVGTLGYYVFKKRSDSKLALEQKIDDNKLALEQIASNERLEQASIEANKKDTEDLKALVKESLKIADKAITAPRYIVSQLAEDDLIHVDNRTINRKEAKEILPVNNQVTNTSVNSDPIIIDDNFELSIWNITSNMVTIKDAVNNLLTPRLNLTKTDEVKKLKDKLPTQKTEEPVTLNLRVAIVLNSDNKVVESFIIEVDPKEGVNPSLNEALLEGQAKLEESEI